MKVKDHIKELKKKMLYSIVPAGAVFVLFLFYSGEIIKRLVDYYDLNGNIISITPSESVSSILIVSSCSFLIVFIPMLMYQMLVFSEVKTNRLKRNMILGSILTLSGFALGITVLSKMVLHGMESYSMVSAYWGIKSVLSFAGLLGLVTAGSVQCIWAIPFVTKSDLINKKTLKKARMFIIALILLAGGLLTPPDIYSQVVFSIPLYVSFEIGMLFSRDRKEVVIC